VREHGGSADLEPLLLEETVGHLLLGTL
jgi:hypothetical protein